MLGGGEAEVRCDGGENKRVVGIGYQSGRSRSRAGMDSVEESSGRRRILADRVQKQK